MACVSERGLYRRPHNKSVLVHFLKSPGAMEYAADVLRRLRDGVGLLPTEQQCCSMRVWPKANKGASRRAASQPSVCELPSASPVVEARRPGEGVPHSYG